MPQTSVIMASYNRGALLETALQSAFGQTYQDFEIIVADDGSTDDTVSRLVKFEGRVKLVNLLRSGKPSVVRNAAIRHASGEFLAFLDSDDLWESTKLECQVRLAAEGGVGYVDEILCRIRVLPGGATGNKTFLFEEALEVIDDICRRFPAECRKNIAAV